ncbi:DNA-processing protein DprA [Parvibacter caecicola]|uniref:DNA-processing protein DprA n=1 Tax=Parvibacter caecicola TaxID=747645 RepID=UPI002730889A|nr:DNA-processing protein DprA [Parvibacter caecicola]
MTNGKVLAGPRFVLGRADAGYPVALRDVPRPPEVIYGVGNPGALTAGLAVVGARKATPYGRGCARRFAGRAAEAGVTIVSGGARGCDSEAHRAALAAGTPTVAVLGGGVDRLYPAENRELFQQIVDSGGAVISEHEWGFAPLRATFRERNRIIAGLGLACLIVEAGLPSGTFSTADEALAAGREVWAVPGAITSFSSRGANRLVYQGAVPIVDDDAFDGSLLSLFGCLKQEVARGESAAASVAATPEERARESLALALAAECCSTEQLVGLVGQWLPGVAPLPWLMTEIAALQRRGIVCQYPDGRFGPRIPDR